jgi:GNAT superfamily N-acetyltransferase
MAKTVTISVPKAVTLALVSFNSTLFASAVRTLLEQDGPHDGRLSPSTLNFYRQPAAHPEGQSVRNGNGRVYAVVASEGNTILGFGGFAVINGQTDFETFVVAKAVRSSDLGTSIVQALVEEARKLTGVQLGSVEVGASNPFALRALVKAGFLPTDSGNTKTRGGNVNTIVLSLPEA